MTTTGADPLSNFDPFMLDERHAAFIRRLFEWSTSCSESADLREHAKRSFLAGTFGWMCAPRSATEDQVFVSTKFLVLFFLIDDAPSDLMNEFIDAMRGTEATSTRGAPSPQRAEFQRYYDDLIASIHARNHDTAEFEEALQNICLAMQEEKQADRSTWSFDQSLRNRKLVVGITCFTECWRAIRGNAFTPEVRQLIDDSGILDITCEQACVVNDLASFNRDADDLMNDPENVDPNLVLSRMHELGGDRDAALSDGVRWYNSKIEQFHRAEQALLSSAQGKDPALRDYLESLHCAIVGDLATSKHLGPMRYANPEQLLARLSMLDELGD